MKIAVFGTGIVGRTISLRLAALGNTVTLGTRNVADSLARNEKDGYGNAPFGDWYAENKSSITLASYAEAAAGADVIFNCTKGQGSVDALTQAGTSNLKNKVIIDTANPLDFSNGAPPFLSPGNTDSLGELIQRTFPEARVVKTLNTMNCFLMVDPTLVPGQHSVFVSGNDAAAKDTAKTILRSFGWSDASIIDLGDITSARGTEQLLPIWVKLYSVFKHAMFNFNIVIPAKP